MAPHERKQFLDCLLEDATHRRAVLQEAAEAKEQEVHQIAASQHLTDDEPNVQPVYTVQEKLASWETIARAFTEMQTTLNKSLSEKVTLWRQDASPSVGSSRS